MVAALLLLQVLPSRLSWCEHFDVPRKIHEAVRAMRLPPLDTHSLGSPNMHHIKHAITEQNHAQAQILPAQVPPSRWAGYTYVFVSVHFVAVISSVVVEFLCIVAVPQWR